jgi:hypothetical protein
MKSTSRYARDAEPFLFAGVGHRPLDEEELVLFRAGVGEPGDQLACRHLFHRATARDRRSDCDVRAHEQAPRGADPAEDRR